MKNAFDKQGLWKLNGFIISLCAKLECNQFL